MREAGRWAARAKLEFDVCLSWLGEDGAWLEGAASSGEAPSSKLQVRNVELGAWSLELGAWSLELPQSSRPEWYSDRMRVLAVLSWEDPPARPSVLRETKWVGVAWSDRPDRPAVGFALDPTEPIQVRPPSEQALNGRLLWLFGEAPGS